MIRDIVEIILRIVREIYRLLTACRSFTELEEGILKLVNKKRRLLTTPLGEIKIERRYYQDKETGEGRFLLDEVLSLRPGLNGKQSPKSLKS